MSDIVERLQGAASALPGCGADGEPVNICTEAAAEIERLRCDVATLNRLICYERATVERLRAELAECRAEMAERDGDAWADRDRDRDGDGLGERGA